MCQVGYLQELLVYQDVWSTEHKISPTCLGAIANLRDLTLLLLKCTAIMYCYMC